ncbi:MAG: hypothetical protein WC718_17135, partial [Phycisphaerales bacterium]
MTRIRGLIGVIVMRLCVCTPFVPAFLIASSALLVPAAADTFVDPFTKSLDQTTRSRIAKILATVDRGEEATSAQVAEVFRPMRY